ncbi:MAG TPA: ribonuclease domain-containing protein [Bacteroidota bacterium]|nr:ribonuclease domain-containing protein [Bacteroidota bacterium]
MLYIPVVKERSPQSAGSARPGAPVAAACFLGLLLVLFGPAAQATLCDPLHHSRQESLRKLSQEVPDAARRVFNYVIEHGRAPAGYAGGRLWQNRERRLPRGADYREYDIHPKVRGVNRGAERIIIDRGSGRGWYTPDHYRSFIRIDRR